MRYLNREHIRDIIEIINFIKGLPSDLASLWDFVNFLFTWIGHSDALPQVWEWLRDIAAGFF